MEENDLVRELVKLIPKEKPEDGVTRWATVKQASPVLIAFDGDKNASGSWVTIVPIDLVGNLAVNDRVLTLTSNGQVYVVGRKGGARVTKSQITDFAHTHAATDIASGTLAAARIGSKTVDAGKLNLPNGRLMRSTDLATSGSAWTKLAFTSNTTANGVTASTTALTVPTAGTYLVMFNVIWSNTAHRRLAEVYVNDVAIMPELRIEINQTGYMSGGVSSLVPLAANSNVQLWYYAAGGTLQQASLSVLQVA